MNEQLRRARARKTLEFGILINRINDKIKDGSEISIDGVKLSEKVKELKFQIKSADNKSINVEYKMHKGYARIQIEDETNTITKDTIKILVKEIHDASNLTENNILSKIQTLFNLDHISSVELEVKYYNGHENGFEKGSKHKDNEDENNVENENDDK